MILCLRILALLSIAVCTQAADKFDIRSQGAKGNGESSDTAAIQAVIDACAQAGGGQVLFPPGRTAGGPRRSAARFDPSSNPRPCSSRTAL